MSSVALKNGFQSQVDYSFLKDLKIYSEENKKSFEKLAMQMGDSTKTIRGTKVQANKSKNQSETSNLGSNRVIRKNSTARSSNHVERYSIQQQPKIRKQELVKVSCSTCNGTGRVEGWRWGKEFVMNDRYGNPIYKQVQVPTPKPCPICNGLGHQTQTVFR